MDVASERMAAVAVLADGVAGEIKHPLDVVAASLEAMDGIVERLLEEHPNKDFEQLEDALDDARVSIERLRLLGRDLQDLAAGSAEGLAAVDVNRVLESSVWLARRQICAHARLVRTWGQVPPVHANGSQLAQLFVNLLVNAAQALPESAHGQNEVRLTTRTDPDGRAVIEVKESRPGVPVELWGCEPDGEGLGVGLSISRSIVEGLGGELQIDSPPGKGLALRVVLPPLMRAAPPLLTG